VRHLLDRRVVFFGGKGGVGKTTCSAALALSASREGRRVLLVSTDPAHSTSDVFELPIGPSVREILPRLHALEIDPDVAVRAYVDRAKEGLAGLFSPNVVHAAARQIELAASMPGVSDAALFERMAEILLGEAGRYDLVVFDTAPTGHSLRLLRMPELMGGWIEALAHRRREAGEAQAVAARAGGASGAADVHDPVLALLRARAERMASARAALTDAEQVGFVLVLIPERLPIEETARAIHALDAAGFPVAGLVVNRVLPEAAEGRFFEARKAQERRYLDEIGRRLSGPPRVRVPQLEADVHGVAALDRVAGYLLADPPGRG
jgi:arsenite-transporting ATPase